MKIAEAAALDKESVLKLLGTTPQGLTSAQARERFAKGGANTLGQHNVYAVGVLWRQLKNPLLILLVATALTSLSLGEHVGAYVILGIIALSVGLGFVNEYRSERAMADLHKKVRHHIVAIRDGRSISVDISTLVPGDIVLLSIGDVVPADIRLCDADAFTCDEAALTGESMPSEKNALPVRSPEGLSAMTCCAFMGATVKSGTAKGVVVSTGTATQFGKIAAHLAEHPPVTAFLQGLSQFSRMLVVVTGILTICIFTVNVALHHPLVEALLFSLAIAVGLTPQLLPAIVTLSMAAGAERLARKAVIVKRLASIEDFGNIDVLFTDKTGTLTEGRIVFSSSLDVVGMPSDEPLKLALLCSDVTLDENGEPAGMPLDCALWQHSHDANISIDGYARIAEVSWDYDRKLMSVVVRGNGAPPFLITKGAPEELLARCTSVGKETVALLEGFFSTGGRVIAVATRDGYTAASVTPAEERGLTLRGLIVFTDPIKSDAAESIARLRLLGIEIRIITGDNAKVAAKVCNDLGLEVKGSLSGAELDALTDAELRERLSSTTIFARVTPEQKSRIIRLQRARGSDVGFLGDGVNDAVALHYADVGISVDSAADVAKDAADIILLQKDLGVLAEGVMEGRRIFSNTIKYVLMGTSSNFGNMFSAAGASLFLAFLPMTAPQILLNNLLYDASEMTIPTDNVDDEMLTRPSHWNIAFIRNFMLLFGPISSIFDYLTFAVMLFVFRAGASLFQSAWFVESLLTQLLIIFVIRTRRIPFFRSRPSTPLAVTTVCCVAIGAVLPYTPLARLLGFVPLPAAFFGALVAMIVAYLILVEIAKGFFFRPLPRAVPSTAEMRHRRRLGRLASRFTKA